MTLGAEKFCSVSVNLNQKENIMKIKVSDIIYTFIGVVCVALSVFSYFGEFIGLLISAIVLISIVKFLIEELAD